MSLFSWIIFGIVAIFSFMPLARIGMFNVNKRYSLFKYTSIFLFIWTILTFLRHSTTNPYAIYYLTLAVYPIVFASTSMLFLAINRYLDKPFLKIYAWIIGILFVADTVFVFTNPLHLLILKISPSANITFDMMNNSGHGWLFLLHTALCYAFVLIIIIFVVQTLYRNLKEQQDIVPFVIIIVGLLVAVSLNIIHIFFKPFVLDPTYISFVIILSLMYGVSLIRDVRLIIFINNNNFIIDNLREMYVIVNQRGFVIDASDELLKTFDVSIEPPITMEDLMRKMGEKAVVFRDSKELGNTYDEDKLYLHMKEKVMELPFFKHSGKFFMFFDETNIQKYINELDYVLSHDLMTELYNRNYYEDNKNKIEGKSKNYALIIFDLDGLKIRNDILGHEAGDDFLKAFANILLEVSKKRKNFIPIRMGGDEFLLIIKDTKAEEVDTIINEISSLATNKDPLKNILFSYGSIINDLKYLNIDKALAKADEKMYEIKKANLIKKKEFEEYLMKKFK